MEINNNETIGIAELESLCNKRISYEMNFLIGNIRVKFKFADELRKIAEYIEINTTEDTAVAG